MVIEYTKLAFVAMLPVIASVVLYDLKKKHPEWDEHSMKYQVIVGVVFGLMSVAGTEWGITLDGYNINCRDAAPICAGLLFGGPAGVIAGLIGGIERWLCVYWGGGTFTRVACSVSTIVVGFASGAIRRFMLDDRRPGWLLALSLGTSLEVFHLTMVFLTNMDHITEAMNVVKVCAAPMVITCGLCVLLSTMSITALSGKQIILRSREQVHIVDVIQRWLVASVVIAFTITLLFVSILQSDMAKRNAQNLMTLSLEDMSKEIEDTAETDMLDLADEMRSEYEETGDFKKASGIVNATEINLIDENGIVVQSNTEENVGYDMASEEATSAYLTLLGEEPEATELVEDFRENAVNGEECKYVGVSCEGGAIQIGFSVEDVMVNIAGKVSNAADNRHIGESGALVIADSSGKIISMPEDYSVLTEQYLVSYNPEDTTEYHMYWIEAAGETYYVMYTTEVGYYIVAILPKTEAMEYRDLSAYLISFAQVLVSTLLFVMIYMLIKKVVVNGIYTTNRTLFEITKGNLDARVNVRHTKEFANLSDGINATVEALKQYIAEANARIDRELKLAKDIQKAALPDALPYGKRTGLYANMDPAKDVGGDFYDFYFTDGHKLVLLIADVSGKGIPAALFMMRAKTQLKGLTETGHTMEEVFTLGNNALCEGNDAQMFVTAWEGVIDLETGLMRYANAGHNPPLLKRAGGSFEYIRSRRGMVLAAMEDMVYQTNEIQLNPGDEIFLYTDGVTEATNAHEELYGEERLQTILNSREFHNMEELCRYVKADVDRFVGEAPQFDDITMLAFSYDGTVQ